MGSESAETIKNYFNSGESGIPAVTIDGGNNQEKNTFTTIPSHKNLAIALLKVLRQMQWEFVSVVLSAQVKVKFGEASPSPIRQKSNPVPQPSYHPFTI